MSTRPRQAAERFGRAHPLALMVTGVVLYSTNPVMVAGTSLSGPAFAFWRMLAGTVVFAVAVGVRRRLETSRPAPRAWMWQLAAGAAFGTQLIMYASALKATSVTNVAIINRLSPIIVGIAAALLFDEHPGRSFRLGSALGIAGAVAVVLGAGSAEGDFTGLLLACGNLVAISTWFVITKAARATVDVPRMLLGTFGIGFLVTAGYVTLVGEPITPVTTADVWLIAGVALVSGGLGHTLTTWPLTWMPVNILPVIMLIQPVLSGMQAWIFLDQGVTWATVGGGALTLAGIGIALLGGSGREMTRSARAEAAAAGSEP